MDACMFSILFFSMFFLTIKAFESNCPMVKCNHDGPDIRFPFRVPGRQPPNCGRPGFDLVCKENTTMIDFPTYGHLVVKSISYDIRKLALLDPKIVSMKLSPSLNQVSCLSDSRNHVYTVESSFPIPFSCKQLKAISIPFSYSPYLAGNSFGLGFTWRLPGCEDCESRGGSCVLQSKQGLKTGCPSIAKDKGFSTVHLFSNGTGSMILSILVFILVMTTMISIKVYFRQKLKVDEAGENENLL
ncbi:RING/U-BOX SUPERFAMILY PROTEIN [Salix koriyanagi]|uniref:RING-type E3 ubiquitin transferase n=1 Tax=Salix koriyanagi TaxID=2511006 RepID=A0A9Q0Q7F1_9ROSI|nr:RING/U-BOX SUPERFAMILY PROTEIN [Salix koriyanagi]